MTPAGGHPDISLYAILDPARSRGRPLAALAEAAVRGGATLLQVRDKTHDRGRRLDTLRAVLKQVAGRVPVLVNDRPEDAAETGADGVHVGPEDATPAAARALLGPRAIIGLSVKSPEAAAAAPIGTIDYAFIGGVFETASKDNRHALGIEGWQAIAAVLRARAPALPIGAIAGIDHGNAGALIGAGADGVAVISALFMADDVEAATAALQARIAEARATREAAR